MTEGAWITLAVSAGGFFTTITAAVIKVPWRELIGGKDRTWVFPSTPATQPVKVTPDPKQCPAHSGIVSDIKALSGGINRIESNQKDMWGAIDEMRDDIKELLKLGGGG